MLICHCLLLMKFSIILQFVVTEALVLLFFSAVRPCFGVRFAVSYNAICRLLAFKRRHIALCPAVRFCFVLYNMLISSSLCYMPYFFVFLPERCFLFRRRHL